MSLEGDRVFACHPRTQAVFVIGGGDKRSTPYETYYRRDGLCLANELKIRSNNIVMYIGNNTFII